MSKFQSCFAQHIENFIEYRKASDRWNESSYEPFLLVFDRFCLKNYPEATMLTQEMIDAWCQKRATETNNSCRSRIYVVYSFVNYLQERKILNLVPPQIPRKDKCTYIPHAFIEHEIETFFDACDNLPAVPAVRQVLILKITAPVFFRLLYSSGIRTTEARLLRTEDVDLEHGILNIHYSKGHNQHYIVLHDSMNELMKRYDRAIRKWYPERNIFFPAPGDQPHPRSWVQKNFRKIWSKVSEDREATAYTFRHYYAITNINQWIGQGFAFNDKLLYLSKSMGHTTIESTKLYYSIVPGLADVLAEKTEDRFNDLIPEVADED